MERKRGESGADPAPEAEQQPGQSGLGTPAQVASPGRPVVRPQADGTFLVVGYRDTRTTLPHPGPGKPVQIKARGLDLDTTGNTSGAGRVRVLSVVKRGELQPAPPRRATKPRARKPPKRAAPHVATCFACSAIATDAYRVEREMLPACHTHGLELLAGDHERVRIVRRHPRQMGRASIGRFRLVKLTMAERAKRERIELAEARERKRRGGATTAPTAGD